MSRPDPTPARRWPRRLLVTAVALGAGWLGGMFALSRLLDPHRLADWIQPRIAAAVNRDVEIRAADVRLVPFEVRLRDVEIADPTGLAPALARVGSVGLKVRLLPLLRREVSVDRITIEGPRVELRVGADGRSNFGDLSAQGDEPAAGERQLALELRSIRVEGGELSYVNDADSTAVTVTDASASSSVRRDPGGPWLLEGRSTARLALARGGRPFVLDGAPLELTFDAEASGDFEELTIRTGALAVEGVAFAVEGRVGGLKDPVRRLDLAATLRDLPIERALAALPDSVRERLGGSAEGTLSAELTVRGEAGPDVKPEVTGHATIAGARVTGRDGTVLAEELAGRITLSADGGLEPDVTGTVLGGATRVTGSATTGPEGRVDLSVRAAPDLGRIASVVRLPEGVTVSGSAPADVRVSGPSRGLGGLSFEGTVDADRIRLTHPEVGVPIEIPTGRLRLEGTRATFSDVPIVLGDDRLQGSGEIRDLLAFTLPERTPYLSGSVRGEHLSLLALRATPPADTALTYGRVAFAHVGGRTVRGRPPEDAAREMGLTRPDSLPLAGTLEVSLDELVDRRGSSRDVRAQVEFGPRFLRVTDARLRRYGGEMRTGFDVALGGSQEEPFTMRLAAVNVDAGELLAATTPLGGLVRGTLTVELDLTGSLDGLLLPNRPSLVGTGRFLVQDGGLNTTPVTERLADFLALEDLRAPDIREWGTSFVLENGTVRLADAVVDGAPGTPRVGGGIGLDGGLDLLAAFALPVSRLDDRALDRLGVAGDVARRVRERDDVVQAVLRIGGDVLDPTLRADAASPAQALATAVQEEAAAEVQKQIAERRNALEERATGFLRGLLQRRDTARAPADTVRPDTLLTQPDTLKPDTLRPDTLRPDTVRRDTIPPDTAAAR